MRILPLSQNVQKKQQRQKQQQETSFKSFIKIEVPQYGVNNKIAEGIADFFKMLAKNDIDIYKVKAASKKKASNVIFIDDQNGKHQEGFCKILDYLIRDRRSFYADNSDLFMEMPSKNKLLQRLFGSYYPNLEKHAECSKPDQIVKI